MDMSLSDEQIDFIQGGVSISLASRDVRRVPSVSKAVACRVAADRRRVCVLLDAGQSQALLRDVASCGALAATFCQPSTHRTLQLKGTVGALAPASDEDAELVRAYVGQVAAVLDVLGMPAQLVARINCLPCTRAELRVEEIYLQTPGPGAGMALGGRAP